MRVEIDGVCVSIDSVPIVTDATLRVEVGEMVAVVGPNGSGKSTLLRAVYRALRPAAGAVLVGGDDVWRLSARQSARRTAVVAQRTAPDVDLTAFEVVETGRLPHQGLVGSPLAGSQRVRDAVIAEECLAAVGMTDVAGRPFATLSGGEQQRVLIARALAQQPGLLVVDEPTNHLDVRYQHEVLALLRSLGVTTVAALHDLALAAAYCDRVALVHRGRLVAYGAPADVLTAGRVTEVFEIPTAVIEHPETGQLVFAHSPAIPPRPPGPRPPHPKELS